MIYRGVKCRLITRWCFPINNCIPVIVLFIGLTLQAITLCAQDSTLHLSKKVVTLKEVVIRNNLNVASFIDHVRNDTSFYKAFKNLKVLGYTSLNDIRMFDKKGQTKASLHGRTQQLTAKGCRWMKTISEEVQGDMYTDDHRFNYYTGEMYAGLFFATDTVCGENNIVRGSEFSLEGKSGMAKHREQLKMLFFNPGKKIPGLPFIGNKVALFEDEVAQYYDFIIDMDVFRGQTCYLFKIVPRADLTESERNKIVINEMTTWFNALDWEILARHYDLSYNAGIFDFDVHMEVELKNFSGLLVPVLLRYNGNWNVILKKREQGVFTATLFDFIDNRPGK